MTLTESQSADAYCRLLTLRHYENFSVASRFVPALQRRDLMRFYGFCRTTDDLGDESGTPELALERLARWRDQTEAFFAGKPPIHPVFIALRETAERIGLDAQPFFDLIAANEADQRVTQYASWPELEAYCMLSAAPVGRVVLHIFGIDDAQARRLSDDVCIGLQLANHAQDIKRDATIGRNYLLQDDLVKGGIPGAVRSLTDRARALLASGLRLEPLAPRALRLQLALYRLGGLAVCDAIARLDYRTDVARPAISKLGKMAIVLKGMRRAASA